MTDLLGTTVDTAVVRVVAPVTLEFAGNEPLEVCLERYSPYFSKYGYADFEPHHHRNWPPSATPRRPTSASGTRSGSTAPSSPTMPCWGSGGRCGPS